MGIPWPSISLASRGESLCHVFPYIATFFLLVARREHFLLCPTLASFCGRPITHQRLRAAYGHGGTGTALRRNWAASLVWKLNDVVTR